MLLERWIMVRLLLALPVFRAANMCAVTPKRAGTGALNAMEVHHVLPEMVRPFEAIATTMSVAERARMPRGIFAMREHVAFLDIRARKGCVTVQLITAEGVMVGDQSMTLKFECRKADLFALKTDKAQVVEVVLRWG